MAIFACPGRAGPVFRLYHSLQYRNETLLCWLFLWAFLPKSHTYDKVIYRTSVKVLDAHQYFRCII